MLRATIEIDDAELDTFALASTAEWRSVCSRRHNVLLEGPQVSTEAILLLLEPHLLDPVAWKRPGAPFKIQTDKGGALVVRDIGALSRTEQGRLLGWLNESSHQRQVVSTTTEPLFPLVELGQFDEALYYRLNVVLLRLDARGLEATPREP